MNTKTKFVYLAPFVALALLLMVLDMTNPVMVGPIGSLIVFGLIYVFISSCLYAIVEVLPYFSHKRRAGVFANVAALGAVLLLALNSLGQLTLLNFMLSLLLVFFGVFYFTRKRAPGL